MTIINITADVSAAAARVEGARQYYSDSVSIGYIGQGDFMEKSDLISLADSMIDRARENYVESGQILLAVYADSDGEMHVSGMITDAGAHFEQLVWTDIEDLDAVNSEDLADEIRRFVTEAMCGEHDMDEAAWASKRFDDFELADEIERGLEEASEKLEELLEGDGEVDFADLEGLRATLIGRASEMKTVEGVEALADLIDDAETIFTAEKKGRKLIVSMSI